MNRVTLPFRRQGIILLNCLAIITWREMWIFWKGFLGLNCLMFWWITAVCRNRSAQMKYWFAKETGKSSWNLMQECQIETVAGVPDARNFYSHRKSLNWSIRINIITRFVLKTEQWQQERRRKWSKCRTRLWSRRRHFDLPPLSWRREGVDRWVVEGRESCPIRIRDLPRLARRRRFPGIRWAGFRKSWPVPKNVINFLRYWRFPRMIWQL